MQIERSRENGDKLRLCGRVGVEAGADCCERLLGGCTVWCPPLRSWNSSSLVPLTCNWQDLLTFDMFGLALSLNSSCHYKHRNPALYMSSQLWTPHLSPLHGTLKAPKKVFYQFFLLLFQFFPIPPSFFGGVWKLAHRQITEAFSDLGKKNIGGICCWSRDAIFLIGGDANKTKRRGRDSERERGRERERRRERKGWVGGRT
jgi:hypothetical protein